MDNTETGSEEFERVCQLAAEFIKVCASDTISVVVLIYDRPSAQLAYLAPDDMDKALALVRLVAGMKPEDATRLRLYGRSKSQKEMD